MAKKRKSSSRKKTKIAEKIEIKETPKEHLSQVQELEKKEIRSFPVGMILLLIVIGIQILNQIQKYFNPMDGLGPIVITGISAILFITVNLVFMLIIFYGIIKRNNWSRNLGMIYFGFWMILGIINIIFFLMNPSMYNPYIMKTIPTEVPSELLNGIIFYTLLSVMVIDELVSILIFSYLYKRKNYFTLIK